MLKYDIKHELNLCKLYVNYIKEATDFLSKNLNKDSLKVLDKAIEIYPDQIDAYKIKGNLSIYNNDLYFK